VSGGLQNLEMTVGEICNRRIQSAPASTTVLEAAKSMHAFEDRLLIVTDRRKGRLCAVGVVTDHELAATIARDGDPRALTIGQIMRPHPGFVTESDGILETALWMRHHGMREVVVHDRDGALLGIVGMERLIESLAADLDGAVPPGAPCGAASRGAAFH